MHSRKKLVTRSPGGQEILLFGGKLGNLAGRIIRNNVKCCNFEGETLNFSKPGAPVFFFQVLEMCNCYKLAVRE